MKKNGNPDHYFDKKTIFNEFLKAGNFIPNYHLGTKNLVVF